MSDLDLKITLRAIDKFSEPARKVAAISGKLAQHLGESQKELFAIGNNRKAIKAFEEASQKLGKLNGNLTETTSKVKQGRREMAYLHRQMELVGSSSKAGKQLAKEFEAARKSVHALERQERRLTEQISESSSKLDERSAKLREAGIDTKNLRQEQDRLGASYAKTTGKMEAMSKMAAQVQKARERHDRALQRAANAALIAHGAQRVGQAAMGMVTQPVQQMRQVERSKGELASLGMQDTEVVAAKGREMSTKLAGITTSAFVSAAYDIKSGISTLTDQSVANMTALAALTAKATKSNVDQMTSLFATGYGSFKNSLFADIGDDEFGQAFSASLAKAVQQFKTDGAKMQQAIQSMGSGLAESGIALSDQFTALGMLQQKMEAGVAGTTLNALERTAGRAQKRFEQMGIAVNTLDKNGNLRSLPELLEQMQGAFGQEYTTETGTRIQEAFGSEEAVRFFKAMWGQQESFRANAKAIEEAQRQGEAFTGTMAKAMDSNMDARLQLMQQRWAAVQQRIGDALLPVLERLMNVIEPIIDGLGAWIDKHPYLTQALAIVVGGVGALALAIAPVITAVTGLGAAITWMGYRAKKAQMEAMLDGMGGGKGGKGWRNKLKGLGRGGPGGKGWGGKLQGIGKGLSGKAGLIGAGVGALTIGATLMDDKLSAGEKAASISGDAGGIGGALAGAAAGAALGSVVPVIGTAIGGALGAYFGAQGGGWLGEQFGSLFTDDEETPVMAGAGAATQNADNSTNTFNLSIQQQPGEDEESLAKRVMGKIQDQQRQRQMAAIYDSP
ncbi:phage tail tape measure protein [Sedimenticola hydrogenitrophicus]|uniref:phage tail tape measure protein n=1 Tax=Sedimenticola hydrogenitrophicus TaxID=2967975 RepID=UPI0023B14275|nr:phage tail tape measure protein [Sedimenticola hydrogenitrophicus]